MGGRYSFWLQPNKAVSMIEGRREISKKPKISMKESSEAFETFTDTLKKNIAGYHELHSDILKYVPQFFELFQSISAKRDLDADTKKLVYSVVSYFVLPYDVIPEDKFGALGYIDDLYLCAYVVNSLKSNEEKRKLIKGCWKEKEDIFELATHVLKKIENTPDRILEKALLEEVLDFVGLKNKELGNAEIKKIWSQQPLEKRECCKCGKKLSPHSQPWNKYCDTCAEGVYGPVKSLTNEIQKLLSKMGE